MIPGDTSSVRAADDTTRAVRRSTSTVTQHRRPARPGGLALPLRRGQSGAVNLTGRPPTAGAWTSRPAQPRGLNRATQAVRLIELAGSREVYGLSNAVNGARLTTGTRPEGETNEL